MEASCFFIATITRYPNTNQKLPSDARKLVKCGIVHLIEKMRLRVFFKYKERKEYFRNFFSYPERFLTHIEYGARIIRIKHLLATGIFMDYYTSPFTVHYGSVKQSKI